MPNRNADNLSDEVVSYKLPDSDENKTVNDIIDKQSKQDKEAGVRHAIKQHGINHSWKRIRNIMSSQTMVTARMKLENRDSLIVRNTSRANMEQAKIDRALNFKPTNPGMRKKAVVPH